MPRVGVDADFGGCAHSQLCQARLLNGHFHLNVFALDCEEACAGGSLRAQRHINSRHHAIHGRLDGGLVQFHLRQIERGLRLEHLRLRGADLRVPGACQQARQLVARLA